MNQIRDLGPYYELTSGQSKARILKKGNNLISLRREGEPDWIYFPGDPAKPPEPLLAGNPFLFPWANRLQSDVYYFQKQGHSVDPLLRDANGLPLHGLMLDQLWTDFSAEAGQNFVRLDSRFCLDKTHRVYQSFPFRQDIVISYVLRSESLHIRTVIVNKGDGPLPLSFGFHPYFRCDVPRHDVRFVLPQAKVVILDESQLPSGEVRDSRNHWPMEGDELRLPEALDDPLTEFSSGSTFALRAGPRTLGVRTRQGFSTLWLYSPGGLHCDFVCLEPMVAPANALGQETAPVLAAGENFIADFTLHF